MSAWHCDEWRSSAASCGIYTGLKTINNCCWRLQFETDFSILKSHRSAKSPTPHPLCTRTFTIAGVCRLNCQRHSTKKLIKGNSKHLCHYAECLNAECRYAERNSRYFLWLWTVHLPLKVYSQTSYLWFIHRGQNNPIITSDNIYEIQRLAESSWQMWNRYSLNFYTLPLTPNNL